MPPVAVRVRHAVHPLKGLVVLKSPQQFMMAGASFVHSGHDSIHDTKAGERTYALRRGSLSRADRPVRARRVLQSPYDCRANGHHASPMPARFNQRGRR